MSTSTLKFAALATTILTTLVSAGPNEAVLLANCVAPSDANFKSSWLGYYSDQSDQAPSAVVQVDAPSGQTAWWEGSPVSGTFSDGDVFSALIPQRITTENAYVGTGKNKYGLFSCWRQSHPNAFTASSGAICSGIYICNHYNDNNAPASGLKVQMTFGSDSVPIEGDYSPVDIFHKVWDQRQASQCQTAPVSIDGTGCTISFDCYGATDWTVTNGMASSLVGVIGKSVMTKETYTTKDCSDVSDITHKCIDWEFNKHIRTHVMNHGRIDVTNESPAGSNVPDSYAGWMTYDIQCPSNKNCAGCQGAEDALGLGAAASGAAQPELAVAFGVANIFATVICQLNGC